VLEPCTANPRQAFALATLALVARTKSADDARGAYATLTPVSLSWHWTSDGLRRRLG
jgi:hypothetical protein